MLSNNGIIFRLGNMVEDINGIGSILCRILPVGGIFIGFMHIQACTLYYVASIHMFDTWDIQFDHWKYFVGGIEAAGDLDRRLYRQKIDEITEYMIWKQIDESTKKKVLSYYALKYRGKFFEEHTLLSDMNNSLRMEIATFNCRKLLEQVPFLKREMNDGRDIIYLGKMATALNAVYYVPGDYVFHQGDYGAEMFFIQAGKVNILVGGKLVATSHAGSFFGEVALIANIPRTATIQAGTACTLYSLSSKDFANIINEFTDMKERIDLIYQDRIATIMSQKLKKVKAMRAKK
ncbi:anaphase-promoting complex subunit Hcn1 [Podochytrium sp. JEL0797]|nr:anaphase-promoting complex subunit Hcn1 [Podochytrium sp. JEL0797]